MYKVKSARRTTPSALDTRLILIYDMPEDREGHRKTSLGNRKYIAGSYTSGRRYGRTALRGLDNHEKCSHFSSSLNFIVNFKREIKHSFKRHTEILKIRTSSTNHEKNKFIISQCTFSNIKRAVVKRCYICSCVKYFYLLNFLNLKKCITLHLHVNFLK